VRIAAVGDRNPEAFLDAAAWHASRSEKVTAGQPH